ncbi:MAG: hypothetical protein U0U70_00415 [Chitinophagaceae bacterium]
MINTRRNFLRRSGILTSAVLVAQPFKTFAGISASLTGNEHNHLVFLHTAKDEFSLFDAEAGYIKNIKTDAPGSILVHSGKRHESAFNFDVPAAADRKEKACTVITKQGLNTGIIYVSPEENNEVEEINRLAAYLKKEKDCQLVVCVSRLGLKNQSALDDLTLAAASRNVDLIISGHNTNCSVRTLVARNSEKHEVIIQSSKNITRDCNKIEFSFDETGAKKHVHVGAKLRKHAAAV